MQREYRVGGRGFGKAALGYTTPAPLSAEQIARRDRLLAVCRMDAEAERRRALVARHKRKQSRRR